MEKAILFPFEINKQNHRAYVQAMELAKEKSCPVICFTTVPPEGSESDLDEVYLHLLDLNGYYQSYVNNWQPNFTTVRKVVQRGEFWKRLKLFREQASQEWKLVSVEQEKG